VNESDFREKEADRQVIDNPKDAVKSFERVQEVGVGEREGLIQHFPQLRVNNRRLSDIPRQRL